MMFRLTTERLYLRHFKVLDHESMYNIFCDAEVMRFSDGVKTREWVHAWLRACHERYRTWGYGPYAVVEKHSHAVMGYCGLFFFPDIAGQAEVEIGYRLARAVWGKGYATEAAQAVCNFAFTTLDIMRLIAIIDPANIASIRVAKKIGMLYEREVMLEDYTHPDHIYTKTAT